MAFKFRLHSVLEHRRHLEELARHEFARRLGALRQSQNHLAWLDQEHFRVRAEFNQRQKKGIPTNDLVLVNEYLTVLRLQALRERARQNILTQEVDKARAKLVEATRARKVLDTLRERHLAAYQRAQLLAEQRLLDEVAVGAHRRRMSS